MPNADSSHVAEAAKQRQEWLWDAHDRYRRNYRELQLSSHGLLLQIDIERAFIAGAWASVIVIAQSIIEATIRDLQTHDYEAKAKALFRYNKRMERIRSLRNEILHPQQPGSPSLVWSSPNGDFAACHAALEPDAKHAIELMYLAVYANSVA